MSLKVPLCGIIFLLSILLWACDTSSQKSPTKSSQSSDLISKQDSLLITPEQLCDKVLGMLLGSAIGDAMGAPTEMWGRKQIDTQFGFVYDLDTMVRAPSPEGTWAYNLPAGGTTDDTRWKKLIIEYLTSLKHSRQGHQSQLSPQKWANVILNRYKQSIDSLKNTDSFHPEPFEDQARKMAWLQEWALVAKPYVNNNLTAYSDALSHFYGGEMVCAGLLYSPVLGAYYPGNPKRAYEEAFNLSIFDIGYARDITAITAAFVAAAMDTSAKPTIIARISRDIDPKGYFKSRLVGRSSYAYFSKISTFIADIKKLKKEEYSLEEISQIPVSSPMDSLEWLQMQRIYQFLDHQQQDMPFHAAEIHIINIAALLFADFDFEKTLAFVVNYGRDNDTVAAITGAILGAYWGAQKLPNESVKRILEVNKERLDIDLEVLARSLTDQILSRYLLVN